MDQQIFDAEMSFRLGRFLREKRPVHVPVSGFEYPEIVDDGAVLGLDTRAGRAAVLPFNKGPRRIAVTADNRFVATSDDQTTLRAVDQGNFILHQRLTGVWLFNLTDAQDRDYPDCVSLFGHLPVLQYCRPISRRDDVALVPLRGYYSDIGGPNVPLVGFDKIGRDSKAATAVWRGAPSGSQVHDGQTLWLSGLIKMWPKLEPVQRHASMSAIRKFDRTRLVLSAQGVEGINAGFSTKGMMKPEWIKGNLPAEMQAWFIPPTHRTKQLKQRYILAIEGNDVASGLYWILASNSLALCGPRQWEVIMDRGLETWTHYAPIEPDAQSVLDRMAELEAYPNFRNQIIDAAQAFMRQKTDTVMRDAVDRQSLTILAKRQRG